MKALIPSNKENKRYLLVRGKNLKSNIEKVILEYIGVLGYSKACPKIIKSGKDFAVLSINRKAINEIRASFAVCSDKIIVEKVGGTLRSLGKK